MDIDVEKTENNFDAFTAAPPEPAFPILKDQLSPEDISLLINEITRRKDIGNNMKDRLVYTLELFFNSSNNKTKQRILDVGCNTGIFSKILAKAGNYVLGLDISSRKIEIAKREIKKLGNHIRFEVADATRNIPRFTREQSVDFVLCTEVLEHIPEYRKVIKAIMKTVRSKGYVLITVPKENQVKDPSHINFFTEDQLREELAEYGNLKFYTPEIPHLKRWLFVILERF